MKRVLPLLMIFVFGFCMLLQGCTGDLNRTAELRESLKAIDKDLNETFSEETCDFTLVTEYLQSWAESSGIEVKKTDDNYIVLENPATEDAGNAESTVMQCSVNTTDCKNSVDILATGLACLLGPTSHGKLRLVVTEYTAGQRIGAESIPSEYVKGDNFINLQYSKSASVYTSGPEQTSCLMKTSTSWTKPSYDSAYKITLRMDKYTDPFSFDKTNNYPNPVNVIGGLLANAKSSGKLFEIASFTSKSVNSYGPYFASATIVINDSHIESITNRFDSSYENIENKFEDLDSDFVYTMTPVDMPEKVLSEKNTNNLVSLMYTLNTGICYQDEETGLVLASSYIKSVETEKNLTLMLTMRARDKENMNNLCNEYEITSGLCDMNFSCSSPKKTWASSADKDLASWFSLRVPVIEGDSAVTMKQYDNDFFEKKAPGLNMISYTFSSLNQNDVLSNIVNFIDPEVER